MRLLNTYISLFWYYLSWQRILLWAGGLGLLIWLLVLIGVSANPGGLNADAIGGLTLMGFLFILFFPYMTSGLAYRSLTSRLQFCLAPEAGRSALAVLFLFTLFMSVTPYLLLLKTEEALSLHMTLRIFILASFFQWLCQLHLPRSLNWFMWVLPWIFLAAVLNQTWFIVSPLLHPASTALLLLIAMAGWIQAFKRTRTVSNLLAAGNMNRELFVINSAPIDSYNLEVPASNNFSAVMSMYFNVLSNYRSMFNGAASRVIIWPFAISVFWLLMAYWNEKIWQTDILPEFFLLISLVVNSVITLRHGELVKRTKLLWLRTGNSRSYLWQKSQSIILADLAMAWALSAMLTIIFLLAGRFSPFTAFAYFLNVVFISFYFTWLTVFCNTRKGLGASPLFLVGLVSAAYFLLTNSFGKSETVFEAYEDLLPVSSFLFIAGLLLRQFTAHTFHAIDWLVIKPEKPGQRDRI